MNGRYGSALARHTPRERRRRRVRMRRDGKTRFGPRDGSRTRRSHRPEQRRSVGLGETPRPRASATRRCRRARPRRSGCWRRHRPERVGRGGRDRLNTMAVDVSAIRSTGVPLRIQWDSVISVRSFAVPSTMTLSSDEAAAAYGRYRMKVRSLARSAALRPDCFGRAGEQRADPLHRNRGTLWFTQAIRPPFAPVARDSGRIPDPRLAARMGTHQPDRRAIPVARVPARAQRDDT